MSKKISYEAKIKSRSLNEFVKYECRCGDSTQNADGVCDTCRLCDELESDSESNSESTEE